MSENIPGAPAVPVEPVASAESVDLTVRRTAVLSKLSRMSYEDQLTVLEGVYGSERLGWFADSEMRRKEAEEREPGGPQPTNEITPKEEASLAYRSGAIFYLRQNPFFLEEKIDQLESALSKVESGSSEA